jgi:hypothetical protein
LTPLGGAPREFTLGVAELAFQPRSLPHTKVAMEFAPYWIWREPPMASPTRIRSGSGYPTDRNTAPWQVDIASSPAPASVMVAGGSFAAAVKVDLKGSRQASPELSARSYEVTRFQVTAWYAREAGRVLKMEHRAWYGNGQPAADEVIELLEHKVEAVAAAAPGPVAAGSPDLKVAGGLLPLQGEVWSYRFTDRKYGRKVQSFTVRVDGVRDSVVSETVEPAGSKVIQRRIELGRLQFNTEALPGDHQLVEFAPYVSQLENPPALPYRIKVDSGYPKSAVSGGEWQVVLARLANAPLKVGSSSLDAQRYQLKGTRQTANGAGHFEVTLWYVPEAKRYVRLEQKTWNSLSSLTTDNLVELVELPGR